MRSSFKSARSPDSSAGAFESKRRELARRSSCRRRRDALLAPHARRANRLCPGTSPTAPTRDPSSALPGTRCLPPPLRIRRLANEYEKEDRRAA